MTKPPHRLVSDTTGAQPPRSEATTSQGLTPSQAACQKQSAARAIAAVAAARLAVKTQQSSFAPEARNPRKRRCVEDAANDSVDTTSAKNLPPGKLFEGVCNEGTDGTLTTKDSPGKRTESAGNASADAASKTSQSEDKSGDDSSSTSPPEWSPPPPPENDSDMTLDEATDLVESAEDEKARACEELEEAREALEEAKRRLEAAKRRHEDAELRNEEADENLDRVGRETMAAFLTEDCYWNRQYEALIEYGRKNGSLYGLRGWLDPKIKDDKHLRNLGAWIGKCRTQYKRVPREIGPHRIALLNWIGFDWDPRESEFQQRVKKLAEYHAEHGTFDIPTDSKNPSSHEERELGKWVCRVRALRVLQNSRGEWKRGDLSQEHIDALDAIGFSWFRYEKEFQDGYEMLVAYRKLHGHCNVPKNYNVSPDAQDLAEWVEWIRKQHKRWEKGAKQMNPLTEKRIGKLVELGFHFQMYDAIWAERYRDFQIEKNKFQTPFVPLRREDNPVLHSWVMVQRKEYLKFKEGTKSTMTDERLAALEKVGFFFDRPTVSNKKTISLMSWKPDEQGDHYLIPFISSAPPPPDDFCDITVAEAMDLAEGGESKKTNTKPPPMPVKASRIQGAESSPARAVPARDSPLSQTTHKKQETNGSLLV